MKTESQKFKLTVFMLALIASIFFLPSAFIIGLPKNTFVNGVNVGGMAKKSAIAAVRESTLSQLKQKELKICAGENMYRFSYPEINFRDNLYELVNGIKKSGNYNTETSYYLNGEKAVISGICSDVNINKTEPYAIFNKEGEPFTYYSGNDGKRIDEKKLIKDVKKSLKGEFETVYAKFVPDICCERLDDVKNRTKLITRFSTLYDCQNAGRSQNIELACRKINGTVIDAGKSFSFNNIVGARTLENGFFNAKIIEGGRFVEGLGGGVCQVSTTLYNAALLSGLKITEYHPHSLKVGYVPPSRDAMVSGDYFDLKFLNSSANPVYVRANAHKGVLSCEIYGESDGATYSISSKIINEISPPEPEEVESISDDFIVGEKPGAESESYLTVTRNGVSVTTLLRRDKYAAVRGVKGKPKI